jgi:hypothetical protein
MHLLGVDENVGISENEGGDKKKKNILGCPLAGEGYELKSMEVLISLMLIGYERGSATGFCHVFISAPGWSRPLS